MKIIISLLVLLISSTNVMEPSDKDAKIQLIVFEGSDWCMKCRQLEKYVLSDTAVINTLRENNIEIVRIDFPQRIKQSAEVKEFNKKMAEQFSFAGKYPTVILSRSDTSLFKSLKIAGNDPQIFQVQILEVMKDITDQN